MAIEKLTARLKTWTIPQIKNHKKSHELKLIRPQTQHKKCRTHVFEIFKIVCAENCGSASWVQVS